MIEGPPFQLPWPLRVIMTWIMKKRMLTQMLPAGFLVPKTAQAKMIPAATTTAEGLELLRAAVRRIQGTASAAYIRPSAKWPLANGTSFNFATARCT